ncbi:unnamed protein product [Polarella glacialis]|uniref:Uncharacterized protein n=1 Tax=Polarella glacialis TaxID=89957 RepID=A0A813KTQ1_POLGL|nr:unnamed protein product [Polarella glacialis]
MLFRYLCSVAAINAAGEAGPSTPDAVCLTLPNPCHVCNPTPQALPALGDIGYDHARSGADLWQRAVQEPGGLLTMTLMEPGKRKMTVPLNFEGNLMSDMALGLVQTPLGGKSGACSGNYQTPPSDSRFSPAQRAAPAWEASAAPLGRRFSDERSSEIGIGGLVAEFDGLLEALSFDSPSTLVDDLGLVLPDDLASNAVFFDDSGTPSFSYRLFRTPAGRVCVVGLARLAGLVAGWSGSVGRVVLVGLVALVVLVGLVGLFGLVGWSVGRLVGSVGLVGLVWSCRSGWSGGSGWFGWVGWVGWVGRVGRSVGQVGLVGSFGHHMDAFGGEGRFSFEETWAFTLFESVRPRTELREESCSRRVAASLEELSAMVTRASRSRPSQPQPSQRQPLSSDPANQAHLCA